jgi:tetratricopeptide (TPR) repeat protein
MALKTVRIFISSPGDVAEERLIARRVIGRLHSQLGDVLRLEPVFWEHEPLRATASFQEQIPSPSRSDIVITILWTRLGTALPQQIRRADGSSYGSGTEFEFEDAVEGFRRTGRPDLMVYRKIAKPDWSSDPDKAAEQLRQQQALDRFIAKWFTNAADGSLRAAFHSFDSPADFEELFEAHLARLVQQHLPPGVRPRASRPTWLRGSPFRGLEPFETEHAPVYFGRTGATANILLKLRRQREAGRAFVLTVSASGAGKSSLIRAGVLPLLLQPGVVGDAKLWRYAIMKPSDGQGDLGLALTQALSQPGALPELAAGNLDTLTTRVGDALEAIAASAAVPGGCHLALVVDQLEEMFSDERIALAECERFVAALASLAHSGCVCVLGTLRSDVYARLTELPQLMELKAGDGQFDLLPPTPREIGQIIRLPASAAGLRFEVREQTAERLDDAIRDAAARNPGALPLLEFLLEELYKRRSSEDVLTFRAYEDLGGVEGALAQRAEQVVAEVSSEARAALPAVLRELVALNVDDSSRVLRRTAPRTAFTTHGANELIDALVAARLLISGSDAQGEATVSLAHEALLQFWPRLAEWREKNRENLHIRSRLTVAVTTWDAHGRNQDFLLSRGKPIAEARALLADGVRLSPNELQLLEASVKRARRFARLRGGAIAGLAILAIRASVAAYLATRQSGIARTQATTAQRTSDFMVKLFAIADPEQNAGEKLTVREMLDRGVAQIQNGLSGEYTVRTNLLRAMGQAYSGLGMFPTAKPLLDQAVTAAEDSGGGDGLVRALNALGANYYWGDRNYKLAAQSYRRALHEGEHLYGTKHPLVTESLAGLADSIFELDQAAEAESLYRRALATDLQLHGELNADTARSLDGFAQLLYYESRYTEAEPLFQRSLVIRRALYGDVHPKVGDTLNHLAALHYQTGKFQLAADEYRQLLPIDRKIYGDVHPQVAASLNDLGRVLLILGDLPAANSYLTEALSIDRQLYPPLHENLIPPLNSLAMISMERGDYANAERMLQEALSIAHQRNHWMLNQVLTNTGDLYVRTDRLDAADAALREARQALQAQYGEQLRGSEAWRVAIIDGVQGSLELARGDIARAQSQLPRACTSMVHRFGSQSLFGRQCGVRLSNLSQIAASKPR